METASGESSSHRPVLLRSQTSAPTQLPWWCERNAGDEPLRLLRTCPRYAPTPLISLPGVAERLGLGEVWIKDETQRLGIGSFKGLGGAYAVLKLALTYVGKRTGRAILPAELLEPGVRSLISELTFSCASDGNHGRSVSAGARLIGARAVVFLHEGVTDERPLISRGSALQSCVLQGTIATRSRLPPKPLLRTVGSPFRTQLVPARMTLLVLLSSRAMPS